MSAHCIEIDHVKRAVQGAIDRGCLSARIRPSGSWMLNSLSAVIRVAVPDHARIMARTVPVGPDDRRCFIGTPESASP